MQTREHPTSFGVFKPVGHVVVAFPSGEDLARARDALAKAGWQAGAIESYEPAEMLAQTEEDLAHAGGVATAGYEIRIARTYQVLASHGYHFLVVPAEDDDSARRVADTVRPFRAGAAQHYGTFVIEELIEPPSDVLDAEAVREQTGRLGD